MLTTGLVMGCIKYPFAEQVKRMRWNGSSARSCFALPLLQFSTEETTPSGARVTYQPGAIQQEGLKERKRQGEAVGICLGKEKVFLLGLHLGDTRSLCLSQQ